jgi:uncharacterized protein YhaN
MSDLIDNAKAKLAKECENNSQLIPFEEYITEKIINDSIASKILDDNKKLTLVFAKIKHKAHETAIGGVGIISDSEAYEMIDEYYGLNKTSVKPAEFLELSDYL